jgi:hypothetical protein
MAPIHNAVYNGNLNRVRVLLNSGTNVNSRGNVGWTPMQGAAEGGHTAIVKLLFNRGANINRRDDNGLTPLMDAAGEGHLDTVRFLLDKGANINARSNNGWTALRCAAESASFPVIRLLLNRGANVNIRGFNNVNNNVRNAIMKHKAGLTIAKYKKASNMRRRAAAAKALGNIKTPNTRKPLPPNITRTIMSLMSPRK